MKNGLKMFRKLLHRYFDIHKWKFVKGNFHKYYECEICQARKVKMNNNPDFVQKVDVVWLHHDDQNYSRMGPPICGWNEIVVRKKREIPMV